MDLQAARTQVGAGWYTPLNHLLSFPNTGNSYRG
jgi:hypothetical protein